MTAGLPRSRTEARTLALPLPSRELAGSAKTVAVEGFGSGKFFYDSNAQLRI
jgi:hypothetical protein